MTDDRIVGYLLEELPEEDLERFVDENSDHESFRIQIDLVEEDLIDAYLRNELTRERRQRFEQNYLTPDREARVSMAAALLRHIDENNVASIPSVAIPSTGTTWADRFRALWGRPVWALGGATAIAIIAVVVTGSWWLFRAPSQRIFATLTLTISNSNRAEGPQGGTVKLTPNTEAVRAFLTLPQPSLGAASYRVELVNDNGEIKSVDLVGQAAESVLVVIPAAQLARGQYAVKLFARQSDGTEQRINGSYFFLVE